MSDQVGYQNVGFFMTRLIRSSVNVSDEMTSQRDIAAQGSTILAAMISNLLPQATVNTSLISSLPVTPSITSYNQAVVSLI